MNLLVTMHENFEIFHCILVGGGFFLDEILDEYLGTKMTNRVTLLYIYGWMGKKLMYYSCGFFWWMNIWMKKWTAPLEEEVTIKLIVTMHEN